MNDIWHSANSDDDVNASGNVVRVRGNLNVVSQLIEHPGARTDWLSRFHGNTEVEWSTVKE
jgi:hypothetical protein